MPAIIPDQLKITLQQRIAVAVTNREAAVDVMKELQRHYGWFSDEALEEAAQLLGLSPLQVEELATFYEMIFRRPVGATVVQICDSISCWAAGGETLCAAVAEQLGIAPGETTADGSVTLLPCSCLGNCGEAPCLLINGRSYGQMTAEKAIAIIEAHRANSSGGVK
jgi:NADH-quinone oxidoreductase subunit E